MSEIKVSLWDDGKAHDGREIIAYNYECSRHKKARQRTCTTCVYADQLQIMQEVALKQNKMAIEYEDKLADEKSLMRSKEESRAELWAKIRDQERTIVKLINKIERLEDERDQIPWRYTNGEEA